MSTVAIGRSRPERERPGFGCPWCGAPLDDLPDKVLIQGWMPCCGCWLDGRTAARLLNGRKLL